MRLKRQMLNGLLRYWLPLITGLPWMLASGAGAVRGQLTGVTVFSDMPIATLVAWYLSRHANCTSSGCVKEVNLFGRKTNVFIRA